MCLKLLSPRGASVGEKDIHMVSRLAHFLYEPIKFLHLRTVCRNRDSLSARSLVRESIERCDSFVACRCFARCDIDFGAASLEKTACFQLAVESLLLGKQISLETFSPQQRRKMQPCSYRGPVDNEVTKLISTTKV